MGEWNFTRLSAHKAAAMAKSDYERTFLPFAKKQDVVLAPINRFKLGKGKGLFNGSKVTSVEELSKWDEDGAPEVRDWDKRGASYWPLTSR